MPDGLFFIYNAGKKIARPEPDYLLFNFLFVSIAFSSLFPLMSFDLLTLSLFSRWHLSSCYRINH